MLALIDFTELLILKKYIIVILVSKNILKKMPQYLMMLNLLNLLWIVFKNFCHIQ